MVALRWEEGGQQEELQLYDIQHDGSGRLDWAAVEKVFGANMVKIKGRGPPGVFPRGDKEGLTRDIFQPGSVILVTVSRNPQGENRASRQADKRMALLQSLGQSLLQRQTAQWQQQQHKKFQVAVDSIF